MRPTVTVVVTNYNHGRFVRGAVESVLSQTCRPDRLVVIDDGSTDDSREILSRLGPDVDVRYQGNQGVVATRNRALDLVDTTHVVFLDADDFLFPGFLRWTTLAWKALPSRSLALVYSPGRIIRGDGSRGYLNALPWDPSALGRGNRIPNLALFLKDALDDVGGYSPAFADLGLEDWELMLKLVDRRWSGRYLPFPLYCLRKSASGRNAASDGLAATAEIIKRHPWAEVGTEVNLRPLVFRPRYWPWAVCRRLDRCRWMLQG